GLGFPHGHRIRTTPVLNLPFRLLLPLSSATPTAEASLREYSENREV
ncbi:hypothetical protein ALC56_02096, partial [Trachymyrmex septentrionalis]